MAKVDAEYREYLDETAAEALERAREHLPGDVPATFVPHSSRSAPGRACSSSPRSTERT